MASDGSLSCLARSPEGPRAPQVLGSSHGAARRWSSAVSADAGFAEAEQHAPLRQMGETLHNFIVAVILVWLPPRLGLWSGGELLRQPPPPKAGGIVQYLPLR